MNQIRPAPPEDARYQVRSVGRALDLLDRLAASQEAVGLSDLARQVGASKSATYAMLQTLCARGLVDSTGEGFARRYTLGMGLARLGHQAARQVTLTDLAQPYLRELTGLTHLGSRVATFDGARAVMLAQVDGPTAVRFNLHMGSREELHCSGIGKAILSTFDDETVRELLGGRDLPRRTARTLTTVEALLVDLQQARERGFAVDDEEDADGICCVGAPVFDHSGGCAGALSVTGLKVSFPGSRVREVGHLVRTSAAALSARLGWLP